MEGFAWRDLATEVMRPNQIFLKMTSQLHNSWFIALATLSLQLVTERVQLIHLLSDEGCLAKACSSTFERVFAVTIQSELTTFN